jgi:CheY-like chemotaxis protein
MTFFGFRPQLVPVKGDTSLRDLRILIVEDELLIALDMQRIVEAAGARQTILVRNWTEVADLEGRVAAFDLAIVTPPHEGPASEATATKLARLCRAVVVCSALRNELAGSPLANAEVLLKPFLEDELLSACARALAARD